jgi:hypothetical protein
MKSAAKLQVWCAIGSLFWSPGCVVSFATLGSGGTLRTASTLGDAARLAPRLVV